MYVPVCTAGEKNNIYFYINYKTDILGRDLSLRACKELGWLCDIYAIGEIIAGAWIDV